MVSNFFFVILVPLPGFLLDNYKKNVILEQNQLPFKPVP